MATLAVLALTGWRALRSKEAQTLLPTEEAAGAPTEIELAVAPVTARPAAEPDLRAAARTPIPAPPSQLTAVTGNRSYAPLPDQDDHVDPEYQARQRGHIVALGQEQLPALEARAQALEAAGDQARAAELRYRVQRLRAHLAQIDTAGDVPAAP